MSKIEWTDKTWNPITGCSWISPGCDNCYARRMANRLHSNPKTPKYWNNFEVTCHPEELNRDFGSKPKKIFVCSMSDLFHKDVKFSFIWQIFRIIRNNPQHTFQILTKRPGRMVQFFQKFEVGFIPENAWIGVTAENQKQLHERVSQLVYIHAKTRFVSIEPILDDVSEEFEIYLKARFIDWVIVGGETGPGAREMNPDWARSIRDQCQSAGVPFFFKQMSKKQLIPDDLNIKEFPKF
jgi:protein gp37